MHSRIYTLCLLFGLAALLANCTLFEPGVASEYDFGTALTQWELNDRPDEAADDSQFEDLTYSRALLADQLDAEGVLVGKYVGDDLSDRDIIGFLLENYIVDANQHVLATVYLMREGRDATGYWAMLVSEDPYWTNEKNLDIYPFAIRIHPNGELWLHNAETAE
ncbi:MAG: hypothetical protein ACPG8W_16335 [Candidatus Promineifilaceae bacterium]